MVGLIAFAGFADSLCPLTLDHGNLVSMVDDLEIVRRRDEDGTALGDGLALAVDDRWGHGEIVGLVPEPAPMGAVKAIESPPGPVSIP